MKYRTAKRNKLRALTSEILPYEVPIPLDVTRLYEYLRWLGFTWTSQHKFTVLKARLGSAQKTWLDLIFDPINLGAGLPAKDEKRVEFDLAAGANGKNKCDLRYPYKFRSRRNNGKTRELAIPHPHSMVQMASFIHEHRDTILYYVNRSKFSIRHPHRVARLQARTSSVFDGVIDRETYGVEQSDLEYAHVSSYFSYRRYNNINRFYSSSEFQACERKYPHLMRADISKCFDSVYTHTVSWVTNGIQASKQGNATGRTFGGKFDHLMQYLNYAETSGIITGPELSRIFAEIILQEVDVRIERELTEAGMRFGENYEIMRYVDDYFVFLANPLKASQVEEVISRNLSPFKLHLNDQKLSHHNTPLKSSMSVAKLHIRETLKRRTEIGIDDSPGSIRPYLYFSSGRAILDYKAILIDTDLEHGDLANSYLYELGRRRDKTVREFRKYLKSAQDSGDRKSTQNSQVMLIRYLMAVLDVAIFIYSGAPSVSHSIKLSRMIAASLEELKVGAFRRLEQTQFSDKVARELVAQLNATHNERSFGIHTLLLLDCLIFVSPTVSEEILRSCLTRRDITVSDLDVYGVLTLLRRFRDPGAQSDLKDDLLEQAKLLIEKGKKSLEFETSRALLLLSLPTFPGASNKVIAKVMGDGFSENFVSQLLQSERRSSMFSWDASEDYYERLLLKSAQAVY